MASFTESVIEDAALAWLEGLGYASKHRAQMGRQSLVRVEFDVACETLKPAFLRVFGLQYV